MGRTVGLNEGRRKEGARRGKEGPCNCSHAYATHEHITDIRSDPQTARDSARSLEAKAAANVDGRAGCRMTSI